MSVSAVTEARPDRKVLAREQLLLQEHHVPPAAELEAATGVHADLVEAEPFVQRDARRIRQRDAADREREALAAQPIEQVRVQLTPDAPSAPAVIHVDAGLDRPAVGRAFTPGMAIGVGDQVAITFEHEPWRTRHHAGDPALEFNDNCFPPAMGGPRNDIGMTGGPANCPCAGTMTIDLVGHILGRAPIPPELQPFLDANQDGALNVADVLMHFGAW